LLVQLVANWKSPLTPIHNQNVFWYISAVSLPVIENIGACGLQKDDTVTCLRNINASPHQEALTCIKLVPAGTSHFIIPVPYIDLCLVHVTVKFIAGQLLFHKSIVASCKYRL
jgi:hypothetical protein